jgi:hypothetical protein
LTGARHPLLDDAASQIRIHQTALGAHHRFAKVRIRDARAPREAREYLGLKDAQTGSYPLPLTIAP